MSLLFTLFRAFDPRPRRESDMSLLTFEDLNSANRALKLLWRWHERAMWARRMWRFIWLVTAVIAAAGWLQ